MNNPTKPLRDIFDAVCAIGVEGPGGYIVPYTNAGCGVFIGEDEVVTSWHVIQERQISNDTLPTSLIVFKNRAGESCRVDKLIFDKEKDLAYLKLKQPLAGHHLPINRRLGFDLTDKFTMLSNFKEKPAEDRSLIKVIHSVRAKIPGAENSGSFDVYLTDKKIVPGYSGSAILVNGSVCSVLSMVRQDSPEQIMASGVYGFKRFVDRARKQVETPPEKPRLRRLLEALNPF
jgi:hypothetical protein